MHRVLFIFCLIVGLYSCKEEEKNQLKDMLDPAYVDHQVEHAFIDMSRKFNESANREIGLVDSLQQEIKGVQNDSVIKNANQLYSAFKNINAQIIKSLETISVLQSQEEMNTVLVQLQKPLIEFKKVLSNQNIEITSEELENLAIDNAQEDIKESKMTKLYYLRFKLVKITKDVLSAELKNTSR